ncbi:hypothetical protein SUGI_0416410 [Cryptomeria japonica]|nr:hypothetical protein SUGI_0416410 [Cryptomeria japonica]
MPQGLEYHGEWDNKKRKNSVLDSLSNSSSDEWDSGSGTAPALKYRKSQLGCQPGRDEEVGNDDVQFIGKEIFDSATCIPMENVRMSEDGLQKDVMVEIQGGKSINHLETPGRQGGKQRTGDRDDQKKHHELLTLNDNRKCMLTIISELKETKEKMLIWLQQEVQKIMNDGCGGSAVRIRNGGQSGGEMEFEEQNGSGPNANSTGITVLGNGSGEIDFGGETSASGGTGYARQNSLVDGAEYNVRNGDTDLNFVDPNSDGGREELGFGKENDNSERMGSGFGSQKSVGQVDVGIGGRINSEGMDFDNQTRCPPGEVPVPLQNGSVGGIPLGNQNSRDAIVGLRAPNVLPGEMTFGAEQTSCGIGLNYASRGSGVVFGRPRFERGIMGRGGVAIRSSVGMVNPQTLVNSRQVNAMQISGEERTPDLFGMHNQSLHSSAPSSMMWNDVVENSRDVSQGISASGFHGIHFDTQKKLSNRGIGSYRGLVCSGTAYENSTGMMNSPALQVTASSSGMHLPISMQNMPHGSLNSSCMQPFLGMQNQAMAQNFFGTQNFLGLSMNGNMGSVPPLLEEGINTHVFPGLYHNDHPRHVLAAKSNPLPGSPGVRGRPYKKGGTGSRTDKLELNT